MTTVVLGWDALDYDLLERFGLTEAFGGHVREIDTIVNSALGEPHTNELWPTLITGLPPEEHGIRASTEDGTVEWDNPLIALAASVANGIVPEQLRTTLGRMLRDRGAGLDYKTPTYYREHGIETVFDGRRGVGLAIPNYVTPHTVDLGLTVDRAPLFQDWVNKRSANGGESWHASRDEGALWDYLISDTFQTLGATTAAAERDVDLVWSWLPLLDTVGHLAPAMADGSQRRAYRVAAEATAIVRQRLQPEDELICVSDHGLQGGHHTETACVAAADGSVVAGVESVLDFADAIDAVTDRDAAEAVEANLIELGYL